MLVFEARKLENVIFIRTSVVVLTGLPKMVHFTTTVLFVESVSLSSHRDSNALIDFILISYSNSFMQSLSCDVPICLV